MLDIPSVFNAEIWKVLSLAKNNEEWALAKL